MIAPKIDLPIAIDPRPVLAAIDIFIEELTEMRDRLKVRLAYVATIVPDDSLPSMQEVNNANCD